MLFQINLEAQSGLRHSPKKVLPFLSKGLLELAVRWKVHEEAAHTGVADTCRGSGTFGGPCLSYTSREESCGQDDSFDPAVGRDDVLLLALHQLHDELFPRRDTGWSQGCQASRSSAPEPPRSTWEKLKAGFRTTRAGQGGVSLPTP